MPTLIRNIDWIKQSIESVVNQPEVQNIFIVVDEIAFSKISELKKIGLSKNVKVLKSEGSGIAQGMNTGIMNVESDYIGRIDDDDISAPNRFKLQIEEIKNYDCDLVFTSLNLVDSAGNISSNISHKELAGNFWKESLVFGCFLNNATLVGKTDFIKNSNLYPLGIRSEDYGFWLSIAVGAKIRTLEQELYSYRQHNHQYTRNRIEQDSNLTNFELWKNYGINLQIPLDFLTLNNFNTLETNLEYENSIFELFLDLIGRLYEQDSQKRIFWTTKLLNKLLDKNFTFTYFSDISRVIFEDLISILIINSINERKKINDLGNIGYELQQRILEFNSSKRSLWRKLIIPFKF
jgi:glycosyltransferase involved in cell wall biosynthesis